jgi:hypothetical protein
MLCLPLCQPKKGKGSFPPFRVTLLTQQGGQEKEGEGGEGGEGVYLLHSKIRYNEIGDSETLRTIPIPSGLPVMYGCDV